MIEHMLLFAAFACLGLAVAAFSVPWTPTPLGAAEKILVLASPQVSAGKAFVPRSSFKQVFLGAAASASPANILASYNTLFGTLVAGAKIFLRVSSINASGFQSTPVETNVIVT
jgi:hypothetical protein